MVWSATKEKELKQASRSAGWRWLGYLAVAGGLVFGVAMWAEYASLRADGADPNAGALFAIPLVLLVLGLAVSLPAEKSAKRAKILRAEKQDAGTA